MNERLRVRLRRLGMAVVVVGAVLAPLLIRAAWEGQAALEQARQARDDDDLDLEIELLGRAARWRVPLASSDDRALDRLLELGAEAEARGVDGRPHALRAYREVRGALLGTRAWGIPREDDYHAANQRIAALMAEQEREFGTDVGGTGDPEAYHLKLLEEPVGPVPWRANLAALSFLLWVVSTVMFVARAIDAHGRLRARPAVRWGAAFLVSLAGWLVLTRFAG